MKILVTGGTGLLGTALINLLRFDDGGHQLTVYARNYAKACRSLHASIEVIDCLTEVHLKSFDAIINLAGEPIFEDRWTPSRKQKLIQSRHQLTEQLSVKINKECSAETPIRFISASAVGVYGPRGSEPILEDTETSAVDFSSELCLNWEQYAFEAKYAKTVTLRTGLVLSNQGGMLSQIVPPFWSGFGGTHGPGDQYMSWIHIKDWANAVKYLLLHKDITGPVNLTAPHPVTNKVFTARLAAVLRRPSFCHLPTFVLKILFGERATLLVTGQNVVPQKLLNHGYQFKFSKLSEALDDLLLI